MSPLPSCYAWLSLGRLRGRCHPPRAQNPLASVTVSLLTGSLEVGGVSWRRNHSIDLLESYVYCKVLSAHATSARESCPARETCAARTFEAVSRSRLDQRNAEPQKPK